MGGKRDRKWGAAREEVDGGAAGKRGRREQSGPAVLPS